MNSKNPPKPPQPKSDEEKVVKADAVFVTGEIKRG